MKKCFIVCSILLGVGIIGLLIDGLPGAVCFGIAALGGDCGVQYWRSLRLKTGNKAIGWTIALGFLFRIVNLLLFIQIARWRFLPREIYVFGAMLLAIPILSIILNTIKPAGR